MTLVVRFGFQGQSSLSFPIEPFPRINRFVVWYSLLLFRSYFNNYIMSAGTPKQALLNVSGMQHEFNCEQKDSSLPHSSSLYLPAPPLILHLQDVLPVLPQSLKLYSKPGLFVYPLPSTCRFYMLQLEPSFSRSSRNYSWSQLCS